MIPAHEPTPEPSPVQRHHHPVALPPAAKDAPARLYFGGSFDPPHTAHTQLPLLAAQTLEQQLDLPQDTCHIIYVPTARSPHKDTLPTPDQHRLEMLKLALTDLPHPATIWTQELDDALLNPDQPSYWADTWAIAHSMTTTGINRFLIGADQARSMHRWRRYTEYWKDAIVLLRNDPDDPNENTPDILIDELRATGAWSPQDLAHWNASILHTPIIDTSSTDLRAHLSDPRTRQTKTPELSPGVHQYILDNDLYR